MFGNQQLSPELLMALGGGIMQGQNLGQGLGTGFQNAATVMGQQKQQAEIKAVENKTRAWLQQQYPGEDFSTATPDMMKAYANEAIKKRFAKPTNDFKVLPDGTYGTWDGTKFNPLGTATKPQDPTSIQRDLQAAGLQPGTPEYQRAILEHYKKSGMVVESTPDGGFRLVQGDLSSAPSKITEGQSKDINWLTRGTNANQELSTLDTKLSELGNSTASKLGTPGNYLKDADYQLAERAGRDFLAVVLRKDSGGAITQAELEEYGPMFLPVPGDKPPAIAAKKKAREVFLKAMQAGIPDQMQKLVPDPNAAKETPDAATKTATQPGSKTEVIVNGKKATIEQVEE